MRILILVILLNTLFVSFGFSKEIDDLMIQNKLIRQYKELQLIADEGVSSVQYELFMLFFQNKEHLQNKSKESLDYLIMAANAHHIDAEFMLGALYQTGTLVGERNFDKAKELILRPAENGNIDAQLMLANNYALRFSRASKSVDKKNYFDKAESWYLKAVMKGSTQAKRQYGQLLLYSSNESKKGIQLLNEAANVGDGSAMHSLGRHAEHLWAKKQDKKNYNIAIYWYEKAIAAGYSKAKENLEELVKKENN